MRRPWSALLACAVGLGALVVVGTASAQDGGKEAGDGGGSEGGATVTPGAILAYYCGEADLQCVITEPLLWEKKVELPIAFNWDTGWIPDNFDELQVRFAVKVPAETIVKLGGKFKTAWPTPLALTVPGDRYTGLLKFDYGLIVEALGKIDISILGYHITWQGPIPYLPQIDFHVLGGEVFDPWAFKPNTVSASAYTASVELFAINILALAEIPSQIAEGGVKLKVKGELKATYWTNQINVTPTKPKEQVVQVLPIKQENAISQHAYKSGPYVEFDVNPEGVVHYDGVLHLIPTFYVSVLGQDFDMPIYDYPITVPIGDQQFNFDKVKVHVPLPDIPRLSQDVYDFGKVDVGTSKKKNLSIANQGEAKARAVAEVEKSMSSIFKVLSSTVTLAPSASEDIQIRFAPKKLGPFQAKLTIASNDPDTPVQTITLKGEAVEPGTAPPDDDPDFPVGEDAGTFVPKEGGTGFYNEQQDSGCACGAAGSGGQNLPASAGLALLGLAALVRRRRDLSR